MPLARGLSSTGRSKRNLLQGPPPSLSEGSSPNKPALQHHRSRSALPSNFERGVSNSTNSTGASGLTTPGERARYVALAMKATADYAIDEALPSLGEAGLPDLVNRVEAQRDNDEQRSTGSTRKSGRGSVTNGSRSGRSRLSEHRSTETQSKASSYSGYRSSRPFAGVSSAFSNDGGFTSHQMFEVAEHVVELCQIPEDEEGDEGSGDLEKENANFLTAIMASHPEVPPADVEGDVPGELNVEDGGAVDEQTPILQQNPKRSPRMIPKPNMMWSLNLRPPPESRFYKVIMWWGEVRKQMRMLTAGFDFPYVRERLWSFIQNDLSMIIVPALAIAAFCFYSLDNPPLRVFKTGASISWGILFLLRHYVTLQLAYMIEYTIVGE